MVDRRQIARPMAVGGCGALPCMPTATKPWPIGFSAATYLGVHAWANAASPRSKGPIGERTG
jgi:hypothetical protein